MSESYFYIRVSTDKQNEARQKKEAERLGILPENLFIDKASGKDENRSAFQKMMKSISAGDTVYIHDQDRLSRDNLDFHATLKEFRDRGIILYLEGAIVDYNNPADSIMRAIKAIGAQEERRKIVKNVTEGVRVSLEKRRKAGAVNASGNLWGGNKTKSLTANQRKRLKRWIDKEESTADTMKLLECSRATLYNLKKKYQNK